MEKLRLTDHRLPDDGRLSLLDRVIPVPDRITTLGPGLAVVPHRIRRRDHENAFQTSPESWFSGGFTKNLGISCGGRFTFRRGQDRIAAVAFDLVSRRVLGVEQLPVVGHSKRRERKQFLSIHSILKHIFKTTMTRRAKWGPKGQCLLLVAICAGAVSSLGADPPTQSKPDWELVHNIPGYTYGDHDTEISPDGIRVVVAYGEESKVIDVASGKETAHLENIGERRIADFSSNGRILSSFPYYGRVACIWDAANGKIVGEFSLPDDLKTGHRYPHFSPDNKKIVAACEKGLLVWDSADLKHVGRIKIKPNSEREDWPFIPLSWNRVTGEAAGVDGDGKLLKIDLQRNTAVPLLPRQIGAVKAVIWSPKGTELMTIDRQTGAVAIWGVSSKKVVARLPEKGVLHAQFSADGKRIVTAAQRAGVVRTDKATPSFWDRWTRVWDAKSGKLIRELPTTTIVSLSSDWSCWAECGPEGVRIARFDGSRPCAFPQFFDGHGGCCVFVQNNRYLVHMNACGRVVVWRERTDSTPASTR